MFLTPDQIDTETVETLVVVDTNRWERPGRDHGSASGTGGSSGPVVGSP